MTPIYRSPDQNQTQAMQSLLLDHRIQTSIIETKKSSNAVNAEPVIWYEIWLRNLPELARAKTIITQHEFTTFRTSMYSYRTSTLVQNESSSRINPNEPQRTAKSTRNISLHEKSSAPTSVASNPFIPGQQSSTTSDNITEARTREDLIPINNKRVFKRLGILLGFSEEEIQKHNNNKLYRPWDADELNESVKRLKQKCS
jgi:hypothetical protein